MLVSISLMSALTLGAASNAASPTERTVTKASVFLVKEPSFLAPRVSPVAIQRGDKVKLEGKPKGAWFPVSFKPKRGARIEGFIHASYVADRPVAFKVDSREVKGEGQVSGNYNLAVPGFRQEVAARRELGQKEAKAGYKVIEQYMPLKDSEAARKRLSSPADPEALQAFVDQGRLRDPGPPPPEEVEAPAQAQEANGTTP